MILNLRQSRLKKIRTKIKYIIIHHTVCQYDIPESKIDNNKLQIQYLINNTIEKKQADLNYHFIIEHIKNDYQIFVCRPFVTVCDYTDIDKNINNSSLHIAMMGSYDFKIPETRLYDILCYRLFNSIIKQFNISINRIYLHNEVSNIVNLSCPGIFINKQEIITRIRKFIIK